jgi:internalin A
MQTKSPVKIFIASSSELKSDRHEFSHFLYEKSDNWAQFGIVLKPVMWENFLDTLSKTRLQDEYNEAIRNCDIFVMLYFSKVGQYTEEEFDLAVGHFKESNKPFVFTYFKDGEIPLGSVSKDDISSLWSFQEKLKQLGHFQST